MCRASVPQQPPTTVTFGSRGRNAAICAASSFGSPSSRSPDSSSSAWLFTEALAAEAPDPLDPHRAVLDDVREVRRVRAVDHEVGGCVVRLRIDLLDRIAQGLAARQAAVGLDRERDGDGYSGCRCRLDRPRSLLGIGHRQHAHQVGAARGECLDLTGVVPLGHRRRHAIRGLVSVTTRTDRAADENRRGAVAAQLVDQSHRVEVDLLERLLGVPELLAPVAVRTPGGGVEEQPDTLFAGKRDVFPVVVAEQTPAVVVLEQVERREVGQVDAVVEDQRRLHPPVRDEELAPELRQRVAPGHLSGGYGELRRATLTGERVFV